MCLGTVEQHCFRAEHCLGSAKISDLLLTPGFGGFALIAYDRAVVAKAAYYNWLNRNGARSVDNPSRRERDWLEAVSQQGTRVGFLVWQVGGALGMRVHRFCVLPAHRRLGGARLLFRALGHAMLANQVHTAWCVSGAEISDGGRYALSRFGFRKEIEHGGQIVFGRRFQSAPSW
jgi:hypothetical protein